MKERNPTVCIVSPLPPPQGGMAVQAIKLAALLRKEGFEVLQVRTNAHFPAFLSVVQQVPRLRTFTNLCLFLKDLRNKAKRADIVYFLTGFFNFFFWVTYPALLLLKAQGNKVILSARGGAAGAFFSMYGPLLCPVLKSLEKITTPSKFLQRSFIDSFGIHPLVVPNIADFEQFEFRERIPLMPRLLVTRSLESIYNVGCVIRAFQRVHQAHPDSILGIAGDGSEREKLEDLVRALGLSDNVVFYGRVDHSRIQDIYNAHDIFVNASNVDNFPGTILEAFASGLPVVSTNAGGIPHMVRDNVTGILVERENCGALAAQVLRLMDNPELATVLARNARKECMKYSWESVRSILIPLLRSCGTR